MKILSVVGARPQFVKLAPIAAEINRRSSLQHVIVHTGQHYDQNMSQAFFDGFGIPAPDFNLEVGSGTHGVQTGAMLARLDSVYAVSRPDVVLVYGDTNSTIAGALSAVKLGIPVVHLEAGLRSFNRHMPEEINRVATDHISDLLLAPTETAMSNLRTEGLDGKSKLVGDVMTDVCLQVRDAVSKKEPKFRNDSYQPYILATIHRAENTDDPVRLKSIVGALQSLEKPVYLVAHPRLTSRAREFGITLEGGAIVTRQPFDYQELISTVMGAEGVVTDSGGLQKEAYLLETPCTTVRSETEWLETLEDGWNVLCDKPSELDEIVNRDRPEFPRGTAFGDGNASAAVIDEIVGMRG